MRYLIATAVVMSFIAVGLGGMNWWADTSAYREERRIWEETVCANVSPEWTTQDECRRVINWMWSQNQNPRSIHLCRMAGLPAFCAKNRDPHAGRPVTIWLIVRGGDEVDLIEIYLTEAQAAKAKIEVP